MYELQKCSPYMSSKLKYSLTSNNKLAKCANSDVLLLKIDILACNKIKELRQLKSCSISRLLMRGCLIDDLVVTCQVYLLLISIITNYIFRNFFYQFSICQFLTREVIFRRYIIYHTSTYLHIIPAFKNANHSV